MEVTMATKITVALEDDLDGGPADETVRFAVGGVEYEIDLNKKNAGRGTSIEMDTCRGNGHAVSLPSVARAARERR